MGKSGKNHSRHRQQPKLPRRLPGGRGRGGGDDGDDGETLPSSAYNLPGKDEGGEEEEAEGDEGEEEEGDGGAAASPSKFQLYQKSVQSPAGDISYMQKFFLMYVGGRLPIHLQEDFCGTALLSAEWLRSDPRRTAIGVDLDLEALKWCLENNLNKVGPDGYSRISLFHGNVLQPHDACLVRCELPDLVKSVALNDPQGCLNITQPVSKSDFTIQAWPSSATDKVLVKKNCLLPARDIVCAFNYSCCCLQRRTDLVSYFKLALSVLSKRGGIFVMDLYGGTSSEHKLRLQRRFSNFTYVWEQEEFDIVNRTTKISLHFHLGKKQILRHAFSYNWRLWSLPEIKDCLEEAGFQHVHFWIREMPDTRESLNSQEFNARSDVKYQEVSSFQQGDAWNAYIVGVAP